MLRTASLRRKEARYVIPANSARLRLAFLTDASAVGRRAPHFKGSHMFAIRSITVDCADPYKQALFWSDVTGWQEDPDDPNHPDGPEGRIVDGHGIRLLFIPVPEGK
jgi:hypothetical protein